MKSGENWSNSFKEVDVLKITKFYTYVYSQGAGVENSQGTKF